MKELLEVEVIEKFVTENFIDVLSINFTDKKVITKDGVFDIPITNDEIETKVKELEAKAKVDNAKQELNAQRDKELEGFTIDGIFMNEKILGAMSVELGVATGDIEWIDVNNKTVTFTKTKFAKLVKDGSAKVKEIYFRYRKLKDGVKI